MCSPKDTGSGLDRESLRGALTPVMLAGIQGSRGIALKPIINRLQENEMFKMLPID
jgi:hypothetical protein